MVILIFLRGYVGTDELTYFTTPEGTGYNSPKSNRVGMHEPTYFLSHLREQAKLHQNQIVHLSWSITVNMS